MFELWAQINGFLSFWRCRTLDIRIQRGRYVIISQSPPRRRCVYPVDTSTAFVYRAPVVAVGRQVPVCR